MHLQKTKKDKKLISPGGESNARLSDIIGDNYSPMP